MIISLDEAKKLNAQLTQDDLDALEVMVRNTTHNSFIDTSVKRTGFVVSNGNTLTFDDDYSIKYLRSGDTVLLDNTTTFDSQGADINDGLYIVDTITDNIVTITDSKSNNPNLFNVEHPSGLIAKIKYPDDVLTGVKKLISYDVKTAANVGLKSRTIARASETYLDVNATDNINGYPSALLGFLKKYTKLRW
ncbi:hypothetical protein [Flyfo myovirus Tbat2_7]|nr:hypothetical protein [Flyfo myovirus Tbat2_7]